MGVRQFLFGTQGETSTQSAAGSGADVARPLRKTTSNASKGGILRRVRSALKGDNSDSVQDSGPAGALPWPEVDANNAETGTIPARRITADKTQPSGRAITASSAQAAQAISAQSVGPIDRPPRPTGEKPNYVASNGQPVRPPSAKSKPTSRSNSASGKGLLGLLKAGSKDFEKKADARSRDIIEAAAASDGTDAHGKRPSDALVCMSPHTRVGGILGVPESIIDTDTSIEDAPAIPPPVIVMGTQTRAGPLPGFPEPAPVPREHGTPTKSTTRSSFQGGIQTSAAAAAAASRGVARDNAAAKADAPYRSRALGHSAAPDRPSQHAGAQAQQASSKAASAKTEGPKREDRQTEKASKDIQNVDEMVPQQSEKSSDFLTSSRSQYNRGASRPAQNFLSMSTPVGSQGLSQIGAQPGNRSTVLTSSTRFGPIWDHSEEDPPLRASYAGSTSTSQVTYPAYGNHQMIGSVMQSSPFQDFPEQRFPTRNFELPPYRPGSYVVAQHLLGDQKEGPASSPEMTNGETREAASETLDSELRHERSQLSVSSPTRTVRVLERAGSSDIPLSNVTLGQNTRMGGFQDGSRGLQSSTSGIDWYAKPKAVADSEWDWGDIAQYHSRPASRLGPRGTRETREVQPFAAALVGPPRIEQHSQASDVGSKDRSCNHATRIDQHSQDSNAGSQERSRNQATGQQANKSQFDDAGDQRFHNQVTGQQANRSLTNDEGSQPSAGNQATVREADKRQDSKAKRPQEGKVRGDDGEDARASKSAKISGGPQQSEKARNDTTDGAKGSDAVKKAAAAEEDDTFDSPKSVKIIDRQGSGNIIPSSKVTLGPRTRAGGFGEWTDDQPSQASANSASAATSYAPSNLGQGNNQATQPSSASQSASPFSGGGGAAIGTGARQHNEDVMGTREDIYPTAVSMPTPGRPRQGNSYSPNEVGGGSPVASTSAQQAAQGGRSGDKESIGSRAKPTKGFSQAGSRDQLALDSEGEEWFTAEGVRSAAGSPEMSSKQLEAKRGQQPVDANARTRDSDKTIAEGLKRDLLQGDTPMSPSSVKQKGYWVELANGRQPGTGPSVPGKP